MNNKFFVWDEVKFSELNEYKEDDKRYYLTPTGERYPSVTTILGASMDKTWLHKWRASVGEEEAKRISTRAAKRGTQFHLICERYIRNEEDFLTRSPPLAIDMFKPIRKYLDQIELVHANEAVLYSHELQTAGRCDLFCTIAGKKVILDFKTASKKKSESDIENYFLQATTYCIMIRELTGIEVPKIVILISVEDEDSQIFIKNSRDYESRVREIFNEYHKAQRCKLESTDVLITS